MNQVDLADFTKNFFGNQAFKNPVPADIKCLVVSDFFKQDLLGGAELTLDAILNKSTVKHMTIRSQELSVELVKHNLDKFWVIGNFAGMQPKTLEAFLTLPVHYSIIEFDYKYCIYRSPFKHFMEKSVGCDCPTSGHGQTIKNFYKKAEKVFWMSAKQRDHYLEVFPELNLPEKNVVQSSTFSEETLGKLQLLRNIFKNSSEKLNKEWVVQASDSWIKGTNEALQWCKSQNMNVKPIGNLEYEQFLIELAKSYGLVFRPLDADTCPRVVIEAKLAGCELSLNGNVQHVDESWFSGTIEEAETYLRTRASHFWEQLVPLIK